MVWQCAPVLGELMSSIAMSSVRFVSTHTHGQFGSPWFCANGDALVLYFVGAVASAIALPCGGDGTIIRLVKLQGTCQAGDSSVQQVVVAAACPSTLAGRQCKLEHVTRTPAYTRARPHIFLHLFHIAFAFISHCFCSCFAFFAFVFPTLFAVRLLIAFVNRTVFLAKLHCNYFVLIVPIAHP